jgi:hypothetical protein
LGSQAHRVSDVDEYTRVITIEAVLASAEPDEQVEVAIAVVVGPGIGLSPQYREELCLRTIETREAGCG